MQIVKRNTGKDGDKWVHLYKISVKVDGHAAHKCEIAHRE